jgi:hypothetical protein
VSRRSRSVRNLEVVIGMAVPARGYPYLPTTCIRVTYLAVKRIEVTRKSSGLEPPCGQIKSIHLNLCWRDSACGFGDSEPRFGDSCANGVSTVDRIHQSSPVACSGQYFLSSAFVRLETHVDDLNGMLTRPKKGWPDAGLPQAKRASCALQAPTIAHCCSFNGRISAF